jgi:NAD(P)-dependent dehydrogenase (short-subunit alcohol dehydrogenase family)
MDGKWDGIVAVVTGGARSIGRTIAETLAARGAQVVSLDLDDSEETVAAVTAAGGSALGLRADVADAAQVERAFAAVAERFGRLDVLVNNAGVFATLARGPFWTLDPTEWDRVMAINVRSVFLCSRAAAAPMRAANAGRIVNVASNTITFGMADLAHYVASKAAVVGVTRTMARELGSHGVTVNAVAPGLVSTETTATWASDVQRERILASQAIHEPLEPVDVAEAVAYLCSPGARRVTGQTLLVNGGAVMSAA